MRSPTARRTCSNNPRRIQNAPAFWVQAWRDCMDGHTNQWMDSTWCDMKVLHSNLSVYGLLQGTHLMCRSRWKANHRHRFSDTVTIPRAGGPYNGHIVVTFTRRCQICQPFVTLSVDLGARALSPDWHRASSTTRACRAASCPSRDSARPLQSRASSTLSSVPAYTLAREPHQTGN